MIRLLLAVFFSIPSDFFGEKVCHFGTVSKKHIDTPNTVDSGDLDTRF
jgi:hypothetical protein